jgi:hypothetical protein
LFPSKLYHNRPTFSCTLNFNWNNPI